MQVKLCGSKSSVKWKQEGKFKVDSAVNLHFHGIPYHIPDFWLGAAVWLILLGNALSGVEI